MDNQNEQITDDDRAQAYRDGHPQCLSCGERLCPFNDDGSLSQYHFNCDDEGGIKVGEHGYVHGGGCLAQFITLSIRDEISKSLEERRGVELNSLTIADRSNNTAIRVYEMLRQIGVVERK